MLFDVERELTKFLAGDMENRENKRKCIIMSCKNVIKTKEFWIKSAENKGKSYRGIERDKEQLRRAKEIISILTKEEENI